jgi:murein DD-endopeptidase MepM/ murein hydrolase activator NlpD
MRYTSLIVVILLASAALCAEPSQPRIDPLFRTVDLDVGQSVGVKLSNGKSVTVKLLAVKEHRCEMRNAVRRAVVLVEVNSRRVELTSAMYNLPKTVCAVQIDCPVTRGYVTRKSNPWALEKAARFRLWPAGAPWVRPGTMAYPVNQRWFASDTQMGNDPVYVNACDIPGRKSIYYHYGLDFGGAEGMVDVLAATDGVVVSRAGKTVSGKHPASVSARYDVVYIRDDRGWYYRYSHLMRIEDSLKLAQRVKMGQKIGTLGKEGGSGGWAHLHFDISTPQPSGRYGITDGYALVFDTYRRRNRSKMIAVARPHLTAWTGKSVTLDATRSWHADGAKRIRRYQWQFTDGKTATGARVTHKYAKPGHYTEVLKITDDTGRVDYDLAVVQVFDKANPLPVPPAIHAACWPTEGAKAGDEITFKVRSYGVKRDEGRETWDFGDGSKPVYTQSDGNARHLAKNGYAVTTHRFAKPGTYIVTVWRTNNRGQRATGRLHLDIAPRTAAKISVDVRQAVEKLVQDANNVASKRDRKERHYVISQDNIRRGETDNKPAAKE